jgi:arabinogalactan oligomer/maltooligosaccharide transport system substrate-binding protein
MKFKKVAALLLAGTMCAAAVVGCGKKDNADDNKKTDAPTTESTDKETDAPSGEKVKATLTVWSPAEDQNEEMGAWLQKTCEAFAKAHPEYELTFNYGVCGEGDAATEVSKDPTAAADVFMYANDQINKLIDAGALARLGGDTEKYIRETNSETIVKSVSIGDAVYGIPFTTNTWFMFYNKDIFSEDDIKNLDKMLAKGKVAFPLSNSWYTPAFYVANGCTYFGDTTDESKGVDYEGQKAVDVTNYLIDMKANPNFVPDVDTAGATGLKNGTVGAMFTGSWDYGNIYEALGDKLGVAALPTYTLNGEEKQMKAFAGSKAIGVNKNSKNLKIATELALFLANEESQQSHFELRNVVPCNTKLLATDAVKANQLCVAQNATYDSTSYPQPFVAAMGDCWGPMENMGKGILAGSITKDSAAKDTADMHEAFNAKIAK